MQIFNAFDNIFGGHDFSVDGHQYHTEDNIFGGENIYEDGKMVANAHSNIFGGQDYYDDKHGVVVTTKSNIFGGHDIYSADHGYEGSTHQGIDGINYIDHSGMQSIATHEMGNVTTILSYSDPLAHVGNYILPTMIL